MSYNQPPPPSGYPAPGGPPPGGAQPPVPQSGPQPGWGTAPPPPGSGPGGPNNWGGPPVAPSPQRKGKGALIAVISVAAVVVLGLVAGGVVWFQNRDTEMVPYTISLPNKLLNGDYYKKEDIPSVCPHSDCLTSVDEVAKLGIKKGFPWAAYYVPPVSKGPTLTVIGIQGGVTKPDVSVDRVLTRMHKDDAKKAKAIGAKVEVIEGTVKTAWKGDTFDGTLMMCESIMMVTKHGPPGSDVTLSRCVWGDTSAVGVVQQQGVGVKGHVMTKNELTDATTEIRNEVRQPHPA
ncbi:hypothetical protein [Streptomyces sp. NPDC101150]|uniref:hypothetical protein n=1 Tax=Streptomyces sp. NPDC101150 TaxID=3366114 RepID=UPI00380B82DF